MENGILMKNTGTIMALALVVLWPAEPAQTRELDALLAGVTKWDHDQDRAPLFALADYIAKAQGATARMQEIEQGLTALLQSNATAAGKDFVCRQLSVMGTEASVPVLAGMLADAKTAEIARFALERIPGRRVDRALREALAKTAGRTRIGIINTLGRRRDPASVDVLGPLAMGQEPGTAEAALFALAEIGNTPAAQALTESLGKTNGGVRVNAARACLMAAERLASEGKPESALSIYRRLYGGDELPTVRAAALRGMGAVGGKQSVSISMEALKGKDPELHPAAIHELGRLAPEQLASVAPSLPEAEHVNALGVLVESGGAIARPAVSAAMKSSSKQVRIAAMEGLAKIGTASAVPELVRIAARGDEAERAAARASLGRMPGKDVDQAVVDGIATAEPAMKLEFIRAAGDRGTAAGIPVLLKVVRDPDTEVRREALRALRETVSATGQIGEVVTAYEQASDKEVRTALLGVLGPSGDAGALRLLRGALRDPDAAVKRSAILALTEWPDGAPIPDLLELARSASNQAHQVLAVRGVLRLASIPAAQRPAGESVKLLAEIMKLAHQAEERRAVLALLPRFPALEGLELARAWAGDAEVGAEARAAIKQLEGALKR
jgi:HEAT repeat protein